ncbi:MAG: ABC transporter ATP-binding protein [Treponema sp.]|nr:ABC transporter ATP-binding protein [Treponema sp.]
MVLKCEDLTVGYEGAGVAQNISFEVKEGDYLCIVGENGAGKSTLVKTLLGLQKPLAGKLERTFDTSELGYLPQQTLVQKDFPATVEEIVLSGCQNKMHLIPFYRPQEKERARHNMERMEITALAKRSYRELSGGQQQRVLLARALCAAEKLLILDEPVAGLDPKVTEELYDFVRRFNEEGTTVIMITHDMSAIRYASHILSLGAFPFFGTKDAFLLTERGKRLTASSGMTLEAEHV